MILLHNYRQLKINEYHKESIVNEVIQFTKRKRQRVNPQESPKINKER